MRIFRFIYIVFLPLIILTCNGGGDGDGNGLPGGEDFSDYEYENEISLTFSGSFSEFNETQFKNDVAASTGATLDQIQITDSGLIQRDGFYVSFIFIESQIIGYPSVTECINSMQDDLSDGNFADYGDVAMTIVNMDDEIDCMLGFGADLGCGCGGPSIGEITDACMLQVQDENDGVIAITSSGSVLYKSNVDIAGFQFTVDQGGLIGISQGGAAEDAGFNLLPGTSVIVGFSLTANVIPSGCGVLMNLDLTCNSIELTDISVSDAAAQSLNFMYYSNLNTCDCSGSVEDCNGICGGVSMPSYECDDGCNVCDSSACQEPSVCDSCIQSYQTADYECCDAAFDDGYTCAQLEVGYDYDCSGCLCLGDCEASGQLTCPDGSTCVDSLDDCPDCIESGSLDDCSVDGDCCPIDWIGDGYCDDINQTYGCNLVCYSLTSNDEVCWMDNGDNSQNINNLPLCPENSIEDNGDCEEDDNDIPETPCDEAGGFSVWIADGYCDLENNIDICDYDGGDCCPTSCLDLAQNGCPDNTYWPGCFPADSIGSACGTCDDCIDPDSSESNYQGDCTPTCGDDICNGDETSETCPDDCFIGGCSPTEVLDCSGDGDCCVKSWIGDGFCDDEAQQWGCDLTCYSLDDNDACIIDDNENLTDLPECPEEALPDNGDCDDNQRGINTGFSTKSKKPLYPQYRIDENNFKNPKRIY